MGNAPSCGQFTGLDFLNCAGIDLLQYEGYQDVTESNLKSLMLLGVDDMIKDAYWDFLLSDTTSAPNPGVNLAEFNQFAIQVGNAETNWGNGLAWEANSATNGGQNFAQLLPQNEVAEATDALSMNNIIMMFYSKTARRIQNLCGSQNFDEVWPAFYWMYNTPGGKVQVDNLVSKLEHNGSPLPPPCVTALQNNWKSEVNGPYGLIGIPDTTTIPADQMVAGYGVNNWRMWNPDNIPNFNDLSDYINKPIWDTPYSQNFWGNPFWTTDERNLAFSAVVGVDYQTGMSLYEEWAQAYVDKGLDVAGKTAANYWNPTQHPGTVSSYTSPYNGNLPSKVSYQVGTEPWHIVTQSSEAYPYHNPCLDKPWLDSVMPYVGGIIGGGFCGIFVPGTYSRVIATATGAYVGFELVASVFGFAATVAWFDGNYSQTDSAADVAAVGFPVALWQMLFDLNLASDQMKAPFVHYGGALAAGALGYYLLGPSLRLSLDVGGGLFVVLSAPIAFLEEGITMLFNGCAGHSDSSTLVCDCEQANTKPLLATALVRDIYGCTENQLSMRLEAMHAAMMTAPIWGSDPVLMGECDGNGHMNNPLACISAGELAYDTYRAEFQQGGQEMWDAISYVVDPTNKSFLPPLDQDKECVQKYGQFFRLDTDGSCKNFQAPPGHQGPGGFDWNKIDDSYKVATCTIL
jgi:hypothetical protein